MKHQITLTLTSKTLTVKKSYTVFQSTQASSIHSNLIDAYDELFWQLSTAARTKRKISKNIR